MSTRRDPSLLGLSEAEALSIGPERAAQVRSFRLILLLAQELRYLTDQLYRADGLTTQQAMLLSIVRARERPSLSDVASATLTTHQNAKQLATALVKKGFLRIVPDSEDARVRRLVTTAKNERHWAGRDVQDFERVAAWFAGLSRAETRQLFGLLGKLQRGLSPQLRAAKGMSPNRGQVDR